MVPFLVIIGGIAICLAANVYGRMMRATDRKRFERYDRFLYPPACFLLACIFGRDGVLQEDAFRSAITLSAAAFFATSFLVSLMYFSRRETRFLKSHSPPENRFGMIDLMLFVTFFALGFGVRAVFQSH